jgi:hypothetical protein
MLPARFGHRREDKSSRFQKNDPFFILIGVVPRGSEGSPLLHGIAQYADGWRASLPSVGVFGGADFNKKSAPECVGSGLRLKEKCVRVRTT